MDLQVSCLPPGYRFYPTDEDLVRYLVDPGLVVQQREMTYPQIDASSVIGRENEKEEIINLLMQPHPHGDGDGDKSLCVIPIVGLGGLGKTTIAKSVFNDKTMDLFFQLKMWVCISDDFNIKKIIINIINSATSSTFTSSSAPSSGLAQSENINDLDIVQLISYYLCKLPQGEEFEKNGVDEEVNRRLSKNIKNNRFDRDGEETETQFWLNIEEILSCYRNVGDHQWNLSSNSSDFKCGLEECLPNPFTWAKKDKHMSITGNMSSHLDNNELYWSNRNVPRDPEFEFQHGYTYEYNQHIRKEITCRFSSFVVSTIVFLGIVYNIWNSLSSIIYVPPLHKEHDHRLSIWSSLLGLFGFMVFVCAVTFMILVGAAFTSIQKAMLIFWVILMHLQSANSIIEVFVTLVGGLSMGWYAFGKKQPPNEVK